MNTIEKKQEAILADFQMMGDGFGQYAYLVELATLLPPLDEGRKTESNLVKGCQSHVWLDIRIENGIFSFNADSDTLIIKGILYLLQDILSGQSVHDVAEETLYFLQKTEIMVNFNADRQKGIGYVIRTLREKAKLAASGKSAC